MQPTEDQPTADQPTNRRVTVAEAALLLGLSEDAVRSRLKRGTLRRDKGPDGTVFVVLGADDRTDRPTTNNDQPASGQSTDQTAPALMQEHLGSLREQLAYLRQQLDAEREANRENRRIIAALVQRVPELEPARETPTEPRDAPTEASEASGKGEGPPEEERRSSWWRRFLGGG